MMRKLGFLLAVGFVGITGTANASSVPCDQVMTSFNSCNGSASCEANIVSQHAECFAGGSTTSTTQINATVFTQAGAISQAISSRQRQSGPGQVAAAEGQSGMAAGGMQAWNVWANHSANNSRISYINSAATNTRNDNNVSTTVIGGDYAWSPKMALGISVGFDRGYGSGSLAGGAPNNTGTSGYSVAPYLSYQIDKIWALDASAGLGEGRYTSGAVKADADRWFATGNLSYNRWRGSWQYSGKLSYLHGEEKYGDSRSNGTTVARTASKNSVDQARLGVQVAYWMNGVMPYAGLVYSSDFNRSTSTGVGVDPLGRSAWVWSLGANFFSLSSKITGGIAYEQEGGRTNSRNETLMGNINFRF